MPCILDHTWQMSYLFYVWLMSGTHIEVFQFHIYYIYMDYGCCMLLLTT